jgi:uncharacterized protein (TIGR02246 family)
MRQGLTARLFGAVSAAMLLYAPQVLSQSDGVRAAIEAGNKKFSAAVANADAAQLASMYTDAAMVLPPNGDVVRGRDAIRKLWQGALDSGVKQATLTTVEVEAHGDTAHEVGTFVMNGEGASVLDRGKYVVIWKREQGQWKLHRDIWNTSLPPAAGR